MVPHQLSLSERHITSAGNIQEIKELCHHVTELDISDNNFTSWAEVNFVANHFMKASY